MRIRELANEVSALKEEFESEKQNLESKVHEAEEHKHILVSYHFFLAI